MTCRRGRQPLPPCGLRNGFSLFVYLHGHEHELVSIIIMWRFFRPSLRNVFTTHMRMSSDQLGELGKGAGKGGGGGGAVREAGGAFGKRQAAEEEMYFKKKEQEQIAALRKHREEEIGHHQKEIERLQEEISRRKDKISQLKKHD